MVSDLKAVDQNKALREFFRWAIREGTWEGVELDGAAIQDKALELGLIVGEPYDPAKHGEQPNVDWDIEPGDNWYVIAPGIK